MKHHRTLLILVGVCVLLAIGSSASAQEIDLGNDGVDMNCDEFPERNAVEGYFAHDGGSAERNVDDLDPNRDGIPCNEDLYDGSDGGTDAEVPTDADSGSDAPVVQLPVTGAGVVSAGTSAGTIALVASLLAMAGAAILGRMYRSR